MPQLALINHTFYLERKIRYRRSFTDEIVASVIKVN